MQEATTEQKYQTLSGLKSSNSIIFECIAGSRLYHLHNEASDLDIRGLFILPKDWHLSIFNPPQEVANDSQDIKYYELKKFVALACDANPTILELLFVPQDCVRFQHPIMQMLIDNRKLFISKQAYPAFVGYSISQLKKARSQGKMVNDEGRYEPGVAKLQQELKKGRLSLAWIETTFSKEIAQSVQKGTEIDPLSFATGVIEERALAALADSDISRLRRPLRKDFCWFIPTRRLGLLWHLKTKFFPRLGENKWPVRPEPLIRSGVDLSRFHAAGLEHVDGLYRLYDYGADARGVFRDAFGLPVLESIPLDDEWVKFRGLLLYNNNAYETAVRDWSRYFEWRANRNEARWHGKDGKNFDYDHKNMAHCVRLLLSGENILKNGEPIVRFQGEQLEYLRGIRSGKFLYEEVMADVEKKMANLEQVKDASALPQTSDRKAINKIYLSMIDEWNQQHPEKAW